MAASHAASAQTPLAPTIGVPQPGNGLAAIEFTAPAANGGPPILGYTATCIPPGGGGAPAIGGHGLGFDFLGPPPTSPAVSTNAFTSTAGSIILASVGRGKFSDFNGGTVSDNKGNGNYGIIDAPHVYTRFNMSGTALYAKVAAAGGANHVVTATKPTDTDEATVVAAEFRNVDTIVDSKWNEDLFSPDVSASVTTTGPAILAAFWWGDDNFGEFNPVPDGAWTPLDHTNLTVTDHVQAGSAYRIVPGAGTYSVTWTPTTAQGAQMWIVAMQQNAGGGPPVSATGTASPVIVNGLTNGVTYQCSVTANNSTGTGASSAAVAVTPAAAAAFGLVSVQSRKTHGGAGTYDVGIDTTQPLAGAVSVESRAIGAGHTIVYQFNGPVTAAGTAGVTPVGTAAAASAGNEVLVTLTNVPDIQRVTVTLDNVNGAFSAPPVSLGFMVGDVNNTRSVNSSDISGVKARSGQATSGANFRFDVNASGAVNSSDISAVKARSGMSLP